MSQQMILVKSVAEVDLLQQALVGVTCDDLQINIKPHLERGSDFINTIQSEKHDTPIIKLTSEQAAELGIHLEVDEKLTSACKNVDSLPTIALEILKNLSFDNDKPLGSTENPIQLVQHDGVLKSVHPINSEQLNEIQSTLQSQQIIKETQLNQLNGCSVNIISNPETQTRVIYRTVFPEDVDLQTPRRGRPIKRGRPKKGAEKSREPSPTPVLKAIRTRSGRVTKPPRHKHFPIKTNIENDQIETKTDSPITTEEAPSPVKSESFNGLPIQKRNVASQFRCPTCKKVYLGYAKMERHIRLFPDHGPIPYRKKSVSLWELALKQARPAPQGGKVVTLLNEFSSMVSKLRGVCSDILKPPNSTDQQYEVDDNLAVLLRIPPGKYSIDESTLFPDDFKTMLLKKAQLAKIDQTTNQMLDESLINPNENVNLILHEDDAGPVILNDTNQSEEMISVDQLVNERLHNLTGGELESHPLSLDLSLDLFQFNPS